YSIATMPAHGTLTPGSGSGPNVTYTPDPNFNGTDSFTFTVNDGSLTSNFATVSITINAVNDAPVANSQSVSTAEDNAVAIALTASDVEGATLSWVIVTGPSHGILMPGMPGSGGAPNFIYTPAANFNGSDSFV